MAKSTIINLNNHLNEFNKSVMKNLSITLSEISLIGQAEMRQVIESSITPYGVERFSKGEGVSEGRRDTDTMYEEVQAVSSDKQAKWGWTGFHNEYFAAQEYGNSRGLSGMHALRESRQKVLDELESLYSEFLRNVKE
jgi:hypothetical protein